MESAVSTRSVSPRTVKNVERASIEVVHRTLRELGLLESLHALEQETGCAFDALHARKLVMDGKFDNVYAYLEKTLLRNDSSVVNIKLLVRVIHAHIAELIAKDEAGKCIPILRKVLYPYIRDTPELQGIFKQMSFLVASGEMYTSHQSYMSLRMEAAAELGRLVSKPTSQITGTFPSVRQLLLRTSGSEGLVDPLNFYLSIEDKMLQTLAAAARPNHPGIFAVLLGPLTSEKRSGTSELSARLMITDVTTVNVLCSHNVQLPAEHCSNVRMKWDRCDGTTLSIQCGSDLYVLFPKIPEKPGSVSPRRTDVKGVILTSEEAEGKLVDSVTVSTKMHSSNRAEVCIVTLTNTGTVRMWNVILWNENDESRVLSSKTIFKAPGNTFESLCVGGISTEVVDPIIVLVDTEKKAVVWNHSSQRLSTLAPSHSVADVTPVSSKQSSVSVCGVSWNALRNQWNVVVDRGDTCSELVVCTSSDGLEDCLANRSNGQNFTLQLGRAPLRFFHISATFVMLLADSGHYIIIPIPSVKNLAANSQLTRRAVPSIFAPSTHRSQITCDVSGIYVAVTAATPTSNGAVVTTVFSADRVQADSKAIACWFRTEANVPPLPVAADKPVPSSASGAREGTGVSDSSAASLAKAKESTTSNKRPRDDGVADSGGSALQSTAAEHSTGVPGVSISKRQRVGLKAIDDDDEEFKSVDLSPNRLGSSLLPQPQPQPTSAAPSAPMPTTIPRLPTEATTRLDFVFSVPQSKSGFVMQPIDLGLSQKQHVYARRFGTKRVKLFCFQTLSGDVGHATIEYASGIFKLVQLGNTHDIVQKLFMPTNFKQFMSVSPLLCHCMGANDTIFAAPYMEGTLAATRVKAKKHVFIEQRRCLGLCTYPLDDKFLVRATLDDDGSRYYLELVETDAGISQSMTRIVSRAQVSSARDGFYLLAVERFRNFAVCFAVNGVPPFTVYPLRGGKFGTGTILHIKGTGSDSTVKSLVKVPNSEGAFVAAIANLGLVGISVSLSDSGLLLARNTFLISKPMRSPVVERVTSMTFDHDGRILVLGTRDSCSLYTVSWDPTTGLPSRPIHTEFIDIPKHVHQVRTEGQDEIGIHSLTLMPKMGADDIFQRVMVTTTSRWMIVVNIRNT